MEAIDTARPRCALVVGVAAVSLVGFLGAPALAADQSCGHSSGTPTGGYPVLDVNGNFVLFGKDYYLKDVEAGGLGHEIYDDLGTPYMIFEDGANGAIPIHFKGGSTGHPVPIKTDVDLQTDHGGGNYLGKDSSLGDKYALNNTTTWSASNFYVHQSNAGGTKIADHPNVEPNQWVTTRSAGADPALVHTSDETGIDSFQFVPA